MTTRASDHRCMFMSQARLRGLPSPMICLSSSRFPSKRKKAVLRSAMGQKQAWLRSVHCSNDEGHLVAEMRQYELIVLRRDRGALCGTPAVVVMCSLPGG